VLADEVLWAMGAEARARTIAVSALVDDPLYSAVANRWPESLPRLGPNPEQLVAIAPSSVILAGFTHAEYRQAAGQRARVVMLESFASFDDYRTNVEAIGNAVGLPDAAATLVDAFASRLRALEDSRPPESTWPSCVSYISGYVAAAGTTFADISRTAGCHNLAAQRGLSGHAPVEVEQLLAWDPEVLVVQCPRNGCEHAISELTRIPGVAALGAVARGDVIPVDARALTSTGAGMLDAVTQLRDGLRARDTEG
jgi:iron complex transport system substrate-binding protein